MNPSKIAHVDMDAFYASVEQRDRPHLRGKPLAVGGAAEGRGVVAAASYEARRFGVRSAMSMRRALQRCPDLVVVPPDFARYRAVSRQLHAILADYTDRIEPLSLDEAYLDLSDDRAELGSATAAAQAIRERVRNELHLTCSAGVSSLKFVAKIASDTRKPDGLTVVPPSKVLTFIHPLPVRRLWGVGPATASRLERRGLHTIGQLAALSEVGALQLLGSRGLYLWRMSHGIDPREVVVERARSSRGSEHTFAADVHDPPAILATLEAQLGRLVAEVRRNGEHPRTLTLKIRYADFETVTRSHTSAQLLADEETPRHWLRELLGRTDVGSRAVRLAGVTLSGFEAAGAGPQLVLPLDAPDDDTHF